jgi:hypothetical protein
MIKIFRSIYCLSSNNQINFIKYIKYSMEAEKSGNIDSTPNKSEPLLKRKSMAESLIDDTSSKKKKPSNIILI